MLTVLHRISLSHKASCIAWLPDNSGLVMGTSQGLAFWRWPDSPQFWSDHSKHPLGVLALSPDGRQAWLGGLIHAPGLLESCHLENGSFADCPTPPTGTVQALGLDAAHQRLFFGSSASELGYWDLASDQTVMLPVPAGDPIRHLALDQAGRRIAWCEESVKGSMLYLWDLEKERGLLNYPVKNNLRLLRFEGDTLIWGECGKNIQLYRLPLTEGKPPAKSKIPKTEFKQHTRPVMTLALSPDHCLAASGSTYNEPKVNLWDAHTGQLLAEYTESITPTSLCFSPDGSMLAVTGSLDVRVLALS